MKSDCHISFGWAISKAGVRAAGAFAWLRGDQPGALEDPADRCRRGRLVALALEMPGDRVRPGVQPAGGQLDPKLDHSLTNRLGRDDRCRLRTPRARLQCV